MKVAELIKVLSQFDQDAEVTIAERVYSYGDYDGINNENAPLVYTDTAGDCTLCPIGLRIELESETEWSAHIRNFTHDPAYTLIAGTPNKYT